jgi:hypothetical protein
MSASGMKSNGNVGDSTSTGVLELKEFMQMKI